MNIIKTFPGLACLTLLFLFPPSLQAQTSPPKNDNFSSGAPLLSSPGSVILDTRFATTETGEPNHGGTVGPNASVWFEWTAPATPVWMVFDTFGSGFDTVLAAYTGSAVDNLTLVKNNDDAGTDTQSRIVFKTTANTTYHLAVDGYDATEKGNGKINWTEISTPANDDFTNATQLTGTTGTENSDTFLASAETGEPNHGGIEGPNSSIWYEWTATGDGAAIFDTFGSDFDTVLAVYTGTSVNSLTLVAANDDAGADVQSQVAFQAVSGTTYYIAVDGFDATETGKVVLNRAPTLANDNLADAEPLTGLKGTYVTSSTFATAETGEPNHGGTTGPGKSLWFSWTAPANPTRMAFSTFSSGFDTVLAVYTDSTPLTYPDLTLAVNNDNDGTYQQSRVAFTPVANTTYYIVVDTANGTVGEVVLNRAPTPANDDFAAAAKLSGTRGSVSGTNFIATTETGEPNHGFDTGPNVSTWYKWTAPTSGKMRFDTIGSDFDAVLAVYTGTAVDNLILMGKDDGTADKNLVEFQAIPGTTYYIAVDGFDDTETGKIILNFEKRFPWPTFLPAITGKPGP